MLIISDRLIRRMVIASATLWTIAAPACNVPVFRYALERWEADGYEVVVFFHEPLTEVQNALVERLEKSGADGLANLTVFKVDLSVGIPQPLQALWKAQDNPSPPWMVVRYPRPSGIEQPAWSGALNAESVGLLLESPARRDIAQKLLSGDAVVWLLLECGDKRLDQEAGQQVEAEIRKLEQTLRLPEPSPLDPPINPDLPLKIAFSIVRVERSDPAEGMLVNLLLNWSTKLLNANEPMLFPIFGRGRVIPPAIGEEIRPEAIREMAEFLTGPCSCEIKELNPGYDLLLTASWNSLAGYQEVMLPELPLVGMSQFAAPTTNNFPASSGQPAATVAAVSPAPVTDGGGNLLRNLVILLAIGIVFLAATTLVLRARSNRNPG